MSDFQTRRGRRLLLACTLCAWTPIASAEERPQWELGAGAAVVSFPDYRGSDHQRTYVLPVPYVVYRGDVLQIDRERIRGLLFKGERVEIDISVNGSVPIRSGNNQARQGMPDLDPTLELGPSLNVLLTEAPKQYKLTFKLPVRAVIASDLRTTHDAGFLTHPLLNLDVAGPDAWKLGFQAGALFGSRRYHAYFYSVDPQYATIGRPAYSAPGGYSGMQFIAAASRRFDNLWVGAFAKYDNVAGAAFDASPLLRRHNNFAAGIGVSWIFARSERRVEAAE